MTDVIRLSVRHSGGLTCQLDTLGARGRAVRGGEAVRKVAVWWGAVRLHKNGVGEGEGRGVSEVLDGRQCMG